MFAYILWQENQRLKSDAEIAQALSAQNTAALQDSLTKVASTIQTMAVRVADLNTDNVKLRQEYRVLSSKYTILAASVKDSGSSIVIDGVDSTGAYREVTFSGHKYIARYSGLTRAYITPLSKARWFINIDFDTVRVQSELVLDKESKLFQIRTTSLTDGIYLLGYTTLDSTSYPILYRGELPISAPVGWFYAGGMASRDFVSLGVAVRIPDWLFLLNYQFFNRVMVESQPWYDRIQVGVYYSLL